MSRPQQLTVNEALSRAKKAAKKGNSALALELYSAVLQQQPNHPVAKKAVRKLAGQQPRSPSPDQINALNSLYHAGRVVEAEQACRELLKSFPQSLNVINVLGASLQIQGKAKEAVEVFDKAIKLKPDFAEAHCNRANALKELGRLEEAVACYDKAIRLKPDFVAAFYNRGNALRDLGQIDDAVASYESAIALKPDFAEALRNLGALIRYEAGDPRIDVMETLYTAASSPDRRELGFALAKAFEDLGDYDRSFEYLAEANRLRKKELRYNIDDDRRLIENIKETFRGTLQDTAFDDDISPRPIFILGMMRSGTSLVEQILASHSEVHGAGELERMNQLAMPLLSDDLSPAKIQTLRRGYIEALQALDVAEKIITDKMPLNFRWIGFILSSLPEAKIVHVSRDSRATCWSIFKHYFPAEGSGHACDLADLAAYHQLYQDLMSFWRERFPDRIYELNYEALTENQEEESRKLLSYCDLEWEEHCLDFHRTKRAVRTSSAAQVRKEIYTGSSEAWRRYEKHLQPLLRGLGY